jgi:hypothetical protein
VTPISRNQASFHLIALFRSFTLTENDFETLKLTK